MKDLRVREIMSSSVHEVSPGMTLVDLESELSSRRISGAPVVERGEVVGIVSRSDIESAISRERTRSAAAATYYFETDLPEGAGSAGASDPTGAALESLRTVKVRDVMAKDVISVSGDDSVVRAAELMRDRRIHRVLVIEGGKLQGILSSLDIVAAVANRG